MKAVWYFQFAPSLAFSLGFFSIDIREKQAVFTDIFGLPQFSAELVVPPKTLQKCGWFHKVNLTFPLSEQKPT